MLQLSEEEWKKRLTPEQYRILRQQDTETPFTGELLNVKDDGMYVCAACGATLFSSKHKFESGSGWPSFYDIAKSDAVTLLDDTSLDVPRVEVKCANCGSHLGHVFDDAYDQPGGQRYCINSTALNFNPKKK